MATIGKQIADFFSGGSTTDNDEGLKGLFVNELRGIYYAEQALVDNLPNMADAATTDQVRMAFQQHLEETRNQVTRLERIFDSIGVEADSKTCNAIDGLADDGDEAISTTETGSLTRDAALIIAGQKVEHHEIAAYGSLHALAQLLGYTEAAQLIEQSLQEEKATDKKLTQLAESFVNERAKSEGRGDETAYSSPNRRNYYDDDDDLNQGSLVGSDASYRNQAGAGYQSGSQSGSGSAYSGGSSTLGGPSSVGGGSSSSGSGYSSGQDVTAGGPLGV